MVLASANNARNRKRVKIMSTYNGWTNYVTWRVNLEIFDGMDPREMEWHRLDAYDLGEA